MKTIEKLREDYGMEDFKLTEEEKHKAIELLDEGDIHGIRYLEKIVRERTYDCPTSERMIDLVRSVKSLNGMVSFGETFNGVHSELYDQIYDLYYEMKIIMLDILGIV